MFLDWKELFSKYKWLAIGIVVIITVAVLAWQYYQNTQEQLRKAVTLTEQQANDNNVLQNKLNISEGNATSLQAVYQAEKNKPSATFYVQAPSIQSAAEQVQQRINNKDQTLPPAALEKTDRTVVVSNNTDQKVDVLKFNLDKAKLGVNVLVITGDGTEFGAGPSWKNRDTSIDFGYTNQKRTYVNTTHYF
jgi:predicted negative regulator of RcsB-dependent stress response